MKVTLPDLPYDYDALQPAISGEIMQIHHQKHHQAYVNNLNIALEGYHDAMAQKDLNNMIAFQSALRFNGGGHLNHSLFWENLAPEGTSKGPEGSLAKAIDQRWGSLKNFIDTFNAQVAPLQGSGWGWLCYCVGSKSVMIWNTSNQDPLFGTTGLIPLLGIDVWEHAYYLQYKNVRPEYLKNIWKVINWKVVSQRYEKAVAP
ncbi:MAG: Superoxide dismutase [Mn] [Chlamydiales bacterium]|nr:Superoxide dismutase [Mn] [Chlamydiales bacterium]MCH9619961.1 Superoxide dismutase [Mn] [Chlamydiales bacterium]MCH9622612.1 Superoxide dismutase [Mn] [Chlamydiales bacterium]